MTAICSAAFSVWSASLRTSVATTTKPRPCSSALAASIAAFKASRFVWLLMSEIRPTMPPISAERSPSCAIILSVSATEPLTIAICCILRRLSRHKLLFSCDDKRLRARACNALNGSLKEPLTISIPYSVAYLAAETRLGGIVYPMGLSN